MKPIWCNRPGCDTKIIFAARPGTSRRLPYLAADVPPFSDQAVGAHVIVTSDAWVPADLIEHFRVRFEISDDQARELVAGYPWHHPHLHSPEAHSTPDERSVA